MATEPVLQEEDRLRHKERKDSGEIQGKTECLQKESVGKGYRKVFHGVRWSVYFGRIRSPPDAKAAAICSQDPVLSGATKSDGTMKCTAAFVLHVFNVRNLRALSVSRPAFGPRHRLKNVVRALASRVFHAS